MAMPTMAMRTAHYLRLTLQVHIGNSLRQVTTSTGGSEAERWASVGGAVVAAIAVGNVARLMLQKAANIVASERLLLQTGHCLLCEQGTCLLCPRKVTAAQQAQPANHNPSTRAPFAPSPGYTPPLDADSDEDSDGGDSMDRAAEGINRAVDRAFPMHPPGTYAPPRDWRRAPTPDAVPMQVS